MRIEYKILWVEDDKSWYKTTLELFTEILDDLGFSLESKKCENIDEVKAEISLNKLKDYDMLLVDYTLKNSDSGDKIIEFIRSIKDEPILTDVLFYSSAVENVRDSMHQLGLEGVYSADRKEIETKFELVLKTTIKKVQDLNNMRGLIMAETSDIDKTMLEIIKAALEKENLGIREKLVKHIFANVEGKVTGKKEDFEKYNENQNINRVLKDTVMFDTSEKIKAVQYIIDLVEHETTQPHKNDIFKASYSDITKKRNLLGHETQNSNEGKIIIGAGEHAFEFNDEFCNEMRKKVRKHGGDLDAMLIFVQSV